MTTTRCRSSTKCLKGYPKILTFVILMVIMASLKFMLTLLIKRRPLLLVPLVLMLTDVCLLVYVIPLLLFKGVCLLPFMVFVKKLWRYSWTISSSMEPLLTIVSTTLIKFCRDVRRQIWCLTGRSATLWSTRELFLATRFLERGIEVDRAKIE